jgi:predicted ester cyclase
MTAVTPDLVPVGPRRHSEGMGSFVDELMRLWAEPLRDQASAELAFRRMYTDPVTVNGTTMSVGDLIARARGLQLAYTDLTHEIVDEVAAPGRLVIGFRLRGRQVGPLRTRLGVVPPSGRIVETRVTDILTLDDDGRIAGIWVVSDDLDTLTQLDAVRLSTR